MKLLNNKINESKEREIKNVTNYYETKSKYFVKYSVKTILLK